MTISPLKQKAGPLTRNRLFSKNSIAKDKLMSTIDLPPPIPADELERRAGALVNELFTSYKFDQVTRRIHRADCRQTAVLALLENPDKPMAYRYQVARNALKEYAWVHIRGLNGGWKSIEAASYTLVDTYSSIDSDEEGEDNIAWRMFGQSVTKRPPEDALIRKEERHELPSQDQIFRTLLVILVGISGERWYPEQIYRAALICSLRMTGHPWADVAHAAGASESECINIYQAYRERHFIPFLAATPISQETMKLRGHMRVQWFEHLRPDWLRRPGKKMIVFPDGIYTITYKVHSTRGGDIEASLQKGARVNGRIKTKSVFLGPASSVTPQLLREKTLLLEQRIQELNKTPRLGNINKSRQHMYAAI